MKSFIIFLQLIFILCTSLCRQTKDIVQTEGITSPLHKRNTGKIFFTSKSIPLAELKEDDFLDHYTFTNKSNLSITVFLDNSITNYMHQLV